MTDIVERLRELAVDTRKWDGRTMTTWDQIRHQVETRKGSELPRLNFEILIEDFAEKMDGAADEIERMRAGLREYACTGTDRPCGCYDQFLSERGEIERLRAEVERLTAALKPFAANVRAVSLSNALGHITREDLWRARDALEYKADTE